jgi:hypothetical protein
MHLETDIKISNISFVRKGGALEIRIDSKVNNNLIVNHEFKELSVKRESEVLMVTDSVRYIDFRKSIGNCKVIENRDNVFKTDILDENGSKIFEIESMISFDFWSYIFEDTLVQDNTNGSSFILRYNPFRFFLPLKMEVIQFSKEVDVEHVIFLSSYLWLKKNMTSHDALN